MVILSYILWGIFWNAVSLLILLLVTAFTLAKRDKIWLGYFQVFCDNRISFIKKKFPKWSIILRNLSFLFPFFTTILCIMRLINMRNQDSFKYGLVGVIMAEDEYSPFFIIDYDEFFREYYPGMTPADLEKLFKV